MTLLLSAPSFGAQTLLLVGGGKRPVEAMKKFVQRAGGEKASILVFPWASDTIEGASNIQAELYSHSAGKVEIVQLDLNDKEKIELKNKIKSASAIFFSGGDQNKLMKYIRDNELYDQLRLAYKNGMPFGGTSAGTAIMSNPMMTGKAELSVIHGKTTELAEGLGLLPKNVIVDQHFVIRSRFNRMAGVIIDQNQLLGIAIDENNSLFITDGNEAQVIGPTQVLFFSATNSKDLNVKILRQGDVFKLNK